MKIDGAPTHTAPRPRVGAGQRERGPAIKDDARPAVRERGAAGRRRRRRLWEAAEGGEEGGEGGRGRGKEQRPGGAPLGPCAPPPPPRRGRWAGPCQLQAPLSPPPPVHSAAPLTF